MHIQNEQNCVEAVEVTEADAQGQIECIDMRLLLSVVIIILLQKKTL